MECRAESAFKALAIAVKEATTRTGGNDIPSKCFPCRGDWTGGTNTALGTKGVL